MSTAIRSKGRPHIRLGRKTVATLAAVGLVLVSASGCGSDSTGDEGARESNNPPATADLEEICASGADDGSFSYISQQEPEAWQQVHEAFSQAWPGIDVDFTSLDAADTTERVLTAALAGKDLPADLVLGGTVSLSPLVEEGLVEDAINWVSLGVPQETLTDQGLLSVARVAYGLAYNREVISEDEVPSTWDELIDEKWEGEVIVDPQGYPFRDLSAEWGLDATRDYLNELHDVVDPLAIQGGTAGITAVLQGEALMATQGRQDSVAQLQKDGAPIEIKYLDTVSQDTDSHLLLKDAEHRDAAACFAAWMATPDGQAVFDEVEQKTNDVRPPGLAEDVPIAIVTTEEEVGVANEISELMADLWGGN